MHHQIILLIYSGKVMIDNEMASCPSDQTKNKIYKTVNNPSCSILINYHNLLVCLIRFHIPHKYTTS